MPVKEVKGGKPFKARVESRFKTDGTLRPSASVATLDVSHYEYFVTIQQQLNKDLRRLFFKHAQFQVYTFNILYEKLFFVQGYKLLFNSSCFWQIRFWFEFYYFYEVLSLALALQKKTSGEIAEIATW